MPSLLRWLLVAAAVAGWWAAAANARPADSGEPPEEESVEPAVVRVPVRAFTDPDSAFGRALRGRLAVMSDRDLSVLESGLRSPAADATAADVDDEPMMSDMPSADNDAAPPQDPSAAVHVTAASPPDGLATASAVLMQERER